MDKRQKITAVVFLHKGGKLFVAKRAETKKFLPGIWELPGGHIEFGETLEKGLTREIKEEFSIDIDVKDPFYVFTYVTDDKSAHFIEVVYFATMKNENQEIHLDPSNHSEYAWIMESKINETFISNNEEGQAAKKGFQIIETEVNNL